MADIPMISDADFDGRVLKASIPVIVDFQGENCPPCRLMEPILEQLSDEYQARVEFVSLDVEASPDTARTYGVRGIPTFIFFKDGDIADRLTGAIPKLIFKSRVDALLGS